jgi:hypothetical protein
MGFRASPEMRASVVRWAESEPDKPSLSAAIRRLVELGLTARPPARPVDKPGSRLRAQELATDAIDIGARRRADRAPATPQQGSQRVSRGARRSAEG